MAKNLFGQIIIFLFVFITNVFFSVQSAFSAPCSFEVKRLNKEILIIDHMMRKNYEQFSGLEKFIRPEFSKQTYELLNVFFTVVDVKTLALGRLVSQPIRVIKNDVAYKFIKSIEKLKLGKSVFTRQEIDEIFEVLYSSVLVPPVGIAKAAKQRQRQIREKFENYHSLKSWLDMHGNQLRSAKANKLTERASLPCYSDNEEIIEVIDSTGKKEIHRSDAMTPTDNTDPLEAFKFAVGAAIGDPFGERTSAKFFKGKKLSRSAFRRHNNLIGTLTQIKAGETATYVVHLNENGEIVAATQISKGKDVAGGFMSMQLSTNLGRPLDINNEIKSVQFTTVMMSKTKSGEFSYRTFTPDASRPLLKKLYEDTQVPIKKLIRKRNISKSNNLIKQQKIYKKKQDKKIQKTIKSIENQENGITDYLNKPQYKGENSQWLNLKDLFQGGYAIDCPAKESLTGVLGNGAIQIYKCIN